MKKITIVGGGTVGALTSAHWSRWANGAEVEWVISPDIPPVTVGEGTTVLVPNALEQTLAFTYNDLAAIGGTPKLGLWKEGWGDGHAYKPPFRMGTTGIHMSATKLHEFARARLAPKIKIVERTVHSHDDVDADYIADCSGTPAELGTACDAATGIPVNAVHVTQCPWEAPKFFMSLTIARPFGWVFGIPLQNRCAVGYMYNKDINTLDDVKQDVQNIFSQFGLTPSSDTLSKEFKNYFRKANFTQRGYYNGNASFFLEPLEATSLGCSVQINQHAWSTIHEQMPISTANSWYRGKLSSVEDLIMTHYLAGSKYKTAFWDFAQSRAAAKLEGSVKTNPAFRQVLRLARQFVYGHTPDIEYGTWGPWMWHENMRELGVFHRMMAWLDAAGSNHG